MSHRVDSLPYGCYWDLWTDPDHPERRVAVLFADGNVYFWNKRGW